MFDLKEPWHCTSRFSRRDGLQTGRHRPPKHRDRPDPRHLDAERLFHNGKRDDDEEQLPLRPGRAHRWHPVGPGADCGQEARVLPRRRLAGRSVRSPPQLCLRRRRFVRAVRPGQHPLRVAACAGCFLRPGRLSAVRYHGFSAGDFVARFLFLRWFAIAILGDGELAGGK